VTVPPIKQKINPDDELFWHRVRESYDLVTRTQGNTIEFELGGRHAVVEAGEHHVLIIVKSVETVQPVLIVP
jgi:hypothetical protein